MGDNGNEDRAECSNRDSDPEEKKPDWDLRVRTVVGPSGASDTIGALAFDSRDYQWLATGGIARKISFFHITSLLDSQYCHKDEEEEDTIEIDGNRIKRSRLNDNVLYVDHKSRIEASVICTSAKLSSLKWDPANGDQVIVSGDYDGVVTEWDVERGVAILERDEHGGRRVWSVDYSVLNTSLCASASDDGTVQIWDKRTSGTIMELSASSKNPVCCAEFSASNASLIAMACSDHRVYVHDIRKIVSTSSSSSSSSSSSALFTLHHHCKPASYVRFFGENMVVSGSIDGSLKLWDISKSMDEVVRPVRTYKGHSNRRSFVGLSVWQEGGLLACGSETNEVYAYDSRWGSPIWVQDFDDKMRFVFGSRPAKMGSFNHDGRQDFSREEMRDDLCFVSGVCWRQKPCDCTLVAANSDGMLQVIIGERKTNTD